MPAFLGGPALAFYYSIRSQPRDIAQAKRAYTIVNAVTSTFSRLLKKAKINAPKGTGFYTLRQTAATLAARSGGPFAVQRLLGHVDLKMATRYVQDVPEQTDKVIENSRPRFEGGRTKQD